MCAVRGLKPTLARMLCRALKARPSSWRFPLVVLPLATRTSEALRTFRLRGSIISARVFRAPHLRGAVKRLLGRGREV